MSNPPHLSSAIRFGELGDVGLREWRNCNNAVLFTCGRELCQALRSSMVRLLNIGACGGFTCVIHHLHRLSPDGAVLWDPMNSSGIAQFGVVQAMALSLGVEWRPVDVRDVLHRGSR
jgi:hypothetical protein